MSYFSYKLLIMKNQFLMPLASMLVLFLLAGCGSRSLEIITCGDDQVFVIDYETSDTGGINILWSWNASEVDDLPEVYREYMRTTDDCKPVDNNKKILITSSGGGIVLVDRKTKKSLFYAHVPNAHSAELLPGGRIAVALSTATGGNSLELYDLNKPDVALYRDSLYSGHGVVWIPGIEKLFALGYSELRAYFLKNWDTEKPELQLEKSWKIPGRSGHDLISVSDSRLILTTVDGVWNFNIPDEEFSPFSPLASMRNVKSVNYDENTGRLIYLACA
jgi:hypothetical protein